MNPVFILVKYQDPRCHKEYNNIYNKVITQSGALIWCKASLETIILGKPFSFFQSKEYKVIYQLKLKETEIAEKKKEN